MADVPVTTAIAQRAWYWNPKLWHYPTLTMASPSFAQEQFGGRWLTFAAAKHPNPNYPSSGTPFLMATEVYRLTDAPPAGYTAHQQAAAAAAHAAAHH
jgi:hypothetical protein